MGSLFWDGFLAAFSSSSGKGYEAKPTYIPDIPTIIYRLQFRI